MMPLSIPGTPTGAEPSPLQPFSPSALQPFLQELLDEQQRLQTPVAEFARAHGARLSGVEALSRSLIPLTAPGPGEQYAFRVDLDACSGCKACVAACHSLNGLDENETWRDVGLLIGGDPEHAFQQTVTTACHHCMDPACLNGCPVLAYEKDPVTGIVRHLDDQCIGCSYCVLTCPYDVPKYNERLGIVRKCDLCHGRLAAGEAPACAQACPTEAITIVSIPVASAAPVLPGVPDPTHTRPSTRYVSGHPLPAHLRPAHEGTIRPQPAHWSLAFMLVGTQASVGALAAGAHRVACAAAVAAIAASVLHLGQPMRAWRVFLGLRRSWLSREIVAFGAYLGLLGLITAIGPSPLLIWITAAVGSLGIVCSIMIYAVTPRRQWTFRWTAVRFIGTTALSAVATAWALSQGASLSLGILLASLTAGVLLMERMRPVDSRQRRLREGPLRRVRRSRYFLGILGGIALPAAACLDPASSMGSAFAAWVLVIIAEVYERHLFFRSVDVSKMPGMPSR